MNEIAVRGPAPGRRSWAVVAAAAVGRSHLRTAQPCQDRFAWSWTGAGLLSAAVADGAGSAPLAQLGAATAVDAVDRLAQRLGSAVHPPAAVAPALFTAFFGAARTAVRYQAWRRGVPLGDLATTLAVAVLGPKHLLLGQVGDGLLTVRRSTGEIVAPVPPARGEYVNETYLLTDPGWAANLTFVCLPADTVSGFALSTDGLRLVATSNPATGAPHGPFYDDIFGAVAQGASPRQLAEFLERVEDRTGDDKCLLVAARRP